MKTIYKYPLKIETPQTIILPIGAKILSIQNQLDEAVLWAIVDNNVKTEQRHFYFFGTGHELPEVFGTDLNYITTIQQDDGNYVWHIFEIIYL